VPQAGAAGRGPQAVGRCRCRRPVPVPQAGAAGRRPVPVPQAGAGAAGRGQWAGITKELARQSSREFIVVSESYELP